MPTPFFKLAAHPIPPNTSVYRYRQGLPELVHMDDPAINVMTDLTRVRVITVLPETAIDTALQTMIHTQVRLLLVVDAGDNIIGLITARDITGEKPVNYAVRNRVAHEQIQVRHIMTKREQIEAWDMREVVEARVGDIVMTLRDVGRQHALVLDATSGQGRIVRGIFSITQVARQLGVEIQAEGRVQSFAEVEALLNA